MTGRAAADAPRSGDDGITLIEVLVAVVLLSLAVVGVLPALNASVKGSALQDRFAGARRWIVAAGDYAASPALPRVTCATPSNYQASIIANVASSAPTGPGWALSVGSVLYQLPANVSTTTTASKGFSTSCSESGNSYKLQLISLQVTRNGAVVETLDVVKSDG